jgi:hypothetical protein
VNFEAPSNITANGVDFGMVNTYTYDLSHELMEAIVNPFAGPNPEIGDQCQKATGVNAPWSTMPSNSGPPWIIASTWSAANKTCWVSEQSQWVNSAGNAFTPLPSSTISYSTWDDESYKSSGFALTRGPSHMDVFSVKNIGAGDRGVLTTTWDTANNPQETQSTQQGWLLVDGDWRTPAGLSSPALPVSPEEIGTVNAAPVGAPVTAVSTSNTAIWAFVAGQTDQISWAYCTNGDGRRTTGTWTKMAPISLHSGSYTVAPGTPIVAVALSGSVDPISLFFAGRNGEIFALQDYILSGWVATTIAPSGTVLTKPHNSLGLPYVSAVARYEVNNSTYDYEVFAADTTGQIQWYEAKNGLPPFSNRVFTGAAVEPGTQIAACRVKLISSRRTVAARFRAIGGTSSCPTDSAR